MKATIEEFTEDTLAVWTTTKQGKRDLIYFSHNKTKVRSVFKMAEALIKSKAPGWRE